MLCYYYCRDLVCVASVPQAIREMGKYARSSVPVVLIMEDVTHWPDALTTLVSTMKS
jgi:hypothetical protein